MAPVSAQSGGADDEAEVIWFLGTLIKASADRTGGAVTVVEVTHAPGFATPRHVPHGADEAFYILAGAMHGYCGEQAWRATAGAFVWLPRGIPHGYAVDGDEPLRALAIRMPGGCDRCDVEVGALAQERTVPPPAAPESEPVRAAAAKDGQEILGPPEA